MTTKIKYVEHYVPQNKISSKEIEERIAKSFPQIPIWILEKLTWVKYRYFVDKNQCASDLAVEAAKKILSKSDVNPDEIDLLIFASASQDILEPATANIVQAKLWLKCPVFDIKNACNSFLNAIQIADAFIKVWVYKKILICSGETPSKVIKFDVKNRLEFKKHFASYTFWDAWAAMLLEKGNDNSGIKKTWFNSDGTYRNLWTIMGGGCLYPRDVSKNYFIGNPAVLRDKFKQIEANILFASLKEIGWQISNIKKFFVHQVAMSNFDHLNKILWVPKEKFETILPYYGNIASCCIPTSISQYLQKNTLLPGDKFVLLGFASGYSVGFILREV